MTVEGCTDVPGLDGSRTWYQVHGDLPGPPDGRAPLVVLHGGPGATHDYLTPLADLASDGRAVVFYDQLGNGNSTHHPERGAEFWTVELFVRELAGLIAHLGIGERYHVLGQSWGGFLAQEHAFTQPTGLRSMVLSNTAASFPDFVTEADKLRAELPPEVEATLREHEAAGTTDDPAYAEACDVFYRRHLCRLDPWPAGVREGLATMDEDPTVFHTMNGPSEFHVIGSIKDWTSLDRLSGITVPTYVVSGEYDEATPALQVPLVEGIGTGGRTEVEQVVMAGCSHLPMWEDRGTYMALVGDWLRRHD